MIKWYPYLIYFNFGLRDNQRFFLILGIMSPFWTHRQAINIPCGVEALESAATLRSMVSRRYARPPAMKLSCR